MATRIVKDAKTGEEIIEEFTFIPPPVSEPPSIEDRRLAIEEALINNEPMRLLLEAIEDNQGLSRGKIIADAKAKVV